MATIRSATDRQRTAITEFEMALTAPGGAPGPAGIDALSFGSAHVPGTAGSAARAAGGFTHETCLPYDRHDVWYRTRLPVVESGASVVLTFGGLATLAEVFLDGERVLSSDNMFHAHEVDVTGRLDMERTLAIRFRSLSAELGVRRPRPRYRTRLVTEQQLRFVRTTLLGRIPAWSPPVAPVGPYRPIAIERRSRLSHTEARLKASLDGVDGVVSGEIVVRAAAGQTVTGASLRVGAETEKLVLSVMEDGTATLSGSVVVRDVEPWWPHTHGGQPLYPVRAVIMVSGTAVELDLGETGFRRVERVEGDRFGLTVNGVPVFCRGACWTPHDVVSLSAPAEAQRDALVRARDAGMNMIRVGGTMIYEDDTFYELCDELGILVFQDFMFANMDYPAGDEPFMDSVKREAREFLWRVSLSPSLAVLCGGSEVEQQAAMMGVPRGQWSNALFEEVLPGLVSEVRPDVPYVPSTPTGGALPFHVDSGIAHYFGVGAYLRPLDDARRAGVSFAAECLAFANVPCEETLEAFLPDGAAPPHHPVWKARVPRDAGPGWDFDDVRDHYVRELFGVDPLRVRYADVGRYLALGRVATGEAMARTFAEFRRAASGCRGGLIWFFRDLWPGAGWGVLDAYGRPKSVYYYLRRVLAPVALFATDEGANGVELCAVNDGPSAIEGMLTLTLLRDGAIVVAEAAANVLVPARGQVSVRADAVLPHFFDTAYAYRFGPQGFHALAGVLRRSDGVALAETVFFPGGLGVDREDLGLEATARPIQGSAGIEVTLRCQRLSRDVAIEAVGYSSDDNYFHLLPGIEKTVRLTPHARGSVPSRFTGSATALNAMTPTKVRLT